MTKNRFSVLHKSTLAAALTLGLSVTTALPAFALDEADKPAIEALIKDYLLNNPEILLGMQEALQAKQEAARVANTANALDQYKTAIYDSEHNVILGDPNAPITVVEFFDYNCGYCKRAAGLLTETIEKHPDVRFILKEFPILSQDSMAAHRVSIAMTKVAPELYQKFHMSLITAQGRATGASAMKLAVDMGVDKAKLETVIKSDQVENAIRENYEIAEAMGINGTPSFIVGDEAVPGAISMQELESRYENLRNCGKTACS